MYRNSYYCNQPKIGPIFPPMKQKIECNTSKPTPLLPTHLSSGLCHKLDICPVGSLNCRDIACCLLQLNRDLLNNKQLPIIGKGKVGEKPCFTFKWLAHTLKASLILHLSATCYHCHSSCVYSHQNTVVSPQKHPANPIIDPKILPRYH